MNIIYENRKNCFDLCFADNGSVTQWVNNKTTESVVNIGPFPYIPQAFFQVINSTHFQWCGPMLMIAEYFAKFTNTRY